MRVSESKPQWLGPTHLIAGNKGAMNAAQIVGHPYWKSVPTELIGPVFLILHCSTMLRP